MTQIEQNNYPEQYQNYLEKVEGEKKQQLEKILKQEQIINICKVVFCVCFLLLFSFGQFGIFEDSLGRRFDITRAVISIFNIDIEVKFLLSLLVTGALPVITLIDEFKVLGKKIKINILNYRGFSPVIWLVLPLDMFLTFQAILAANKSNQNVLLVHSIALAMAAIFTMLSFFLSKKIADIAITILLIRKNLHIIRLYNINPIPFYQNTEQIKLIEEIELAKKEVEKAQAELEEERTNSQQNLQNQQQDFAEQLQIKEVEYSQELQERETQIKKYKDKLEEVNQLKTKFNQLKAKLNEISKPIQAIVDKNKEFTEIDASIKDFKFPSLDVTQNGNGKTLEIPTYYFSWQNSDYSWQNLQLPSELTSIAYSFLNTMQQQRVLPPPYIRNYAPRNELPKCLVLGFDNYGVIVYCRDEEYRKNAVKWDNEAELDFQRKLVDDQNRGYRILEFTAQQIMSNQIAVLEQIKEAIDSKMGWESN